MLKHLDERRRDDTGFTLIELMVVVLILGILMAIAIPTFLSTTKSAKTVAAESNATNAATSEVSNFSTASGFLPSASGTTLDPAIPWNTNTVTSNAAANTVLALVGQGDGAVGGTWTVAPADATTTTPNVLILESYASTGQCYVVIDDQSLTTPEIGYFETNTGGCPALPAASPGAGTPTTGSASSHAGAWPTTLTWTSLYSTF